MPTVLHSATMSEAKCRSLVLPTELVHKILTTVIVDCIHLLALSPEEHSWELNVFRTLSSVSYTFNQLAMRIAIKAFAIDDSSDVLSVVESKLASLHTDIVQKSSRKPSIVPPTYVDCNLLKAYILFIAVRQLWLSCAKDAPSNIFLLTETCIHAACAVTLQVCDDADVRPFTRRLVRSVEELRDMSTSARILVTSCATLDNYLQELKATEEKDVCEALKHTMYSTITAISNSERTYSEIEKQNLIGLNKPLPSSKLPDVLAVISKLSEFGLSEDLDYLYDRILQSKSQGRNMLKLEHCLEVAV